MIRAAFVTLALSVLLAAAWPESVMAAVSSVVGWVYATNVAQFIDAETWRAICFP